VQDTLGEIIAAAPKPRGEGAWAWVRYHAIRSRDAVMSDEGKCQVPGCPRASRNYLFGGPLLCRPHREQAGGWYRWPPQLRPTDVTRTEEPIAPATWPSRPLRLPSGRG
jgi:hypothetical protein